MMSIVRVVGAIGAIPSVAHMIGGPPNGVNSAGARLTGLSRQPYDSGTR